MTRDERRAELLAGGLRIPEAEEVLADESVDGAWCDGAIVLDGRGKRCVTQSTIDRVRLAREGSPLPSSPAPPPIGRGVVIVGALVVGLGVLVVLSR